jgi:hypothetical protein
MMEHDVPKNWLVRVLFYIRVFSMGRRRGFEVLRSEDEQFSRHFGRVEKLKLKSGRTKVIIGERASQTEHLSSQSK